MEFLSLLCSNENSPGIKLFRVLFIATREILKVGVYGSLKFILSKKILLSSHFENFVLLLTEKRSHYRDIQADHFPLSHKGIATRSLSLFGNINYAEGSRNLILSKFLILYWKPIIKWCITISLFLANFNELKEGRN